MERWRAPMIGALVGFAVWAAWPRASRACSCSPPKPPGIAATEADAVFEGRAGRPVPDGGLYRYPFEVLRVFRGSVPARVDIFTAMHSAACGRSFDHQTRYVVYARRQGDEKLHVSLCSRTRESDRAAEDLLALGGGMPPQRDETGSPVEALDPGPTTEPPRIEVRPAGATEAGPPAPGPSGKRGCTAGEMPHGSPARGLALLALLAIAKPRRRVLA